MAKQPGRVRELVGPDVDVEQELRVTLEARRELGSGMDDALVRSFLEKIDREVDRRIQVGIATRERALARRERPGWSYLLSAFVAVSSLGAAVPVTIAVVAGGGGLIGVAVVWVVILIINLLTFVRR